MQYQQPKNCPPQFFSKKNHTSKTSKVVRRRNSLRNEETVEPETHNKETKLK
jgi:hypothetical protein